MEGQCGLGCPELAEANRRLLLRHAKVTTTLDLYSQAIDVAKLEAQEEIALAIRSAARRRLARLYRRESSWFWLPLSLCGLGKVATSN